MSFFEQIKKFNEMYKMPRNGEFPWYDRLEDFRDILKEEFSEDQAIFDAVGQDNVDVFEVKTLLADWLGDIIVYCASEARRWGIDIEAVLKIIMESNFSKLGADGKPIYDERGKVLEGPNYWKPEPKIRELLEKQAAKV